MVKRDVAVASLAVAFGAAAAFESLMPVDVIDLPAARAIFSTRNGGVSEGPTARSTWGSSPTTSRIE